MEITKDVKYIERYKETAYGAAEDCAAVLIARDGVCINAYIKLLAHKFEAGSSGVPSVQFGRMIDDLEAAAAAGRAVLKAFNESGDKRWDKN